jgi:hypothetical protein
VLTAPVEVESTRYTIANLNQRAYGFGQGGADEYDCQFKGNTVLSVGPPRIAPGGRYLGWYRVFEREHLRAAEAPMKETPEYVHGRVIAW